MGLTVAQDSALNAVIAPDVTLTISGAIRSGGGTLNANITGNLATGFTKFGADTLVMSGNSDFTGQFSITGGVLSINTIANGGQASAMGASSEIAMSADSTLRYTGASATTDRKVTINSLTGHPATIDVANAATVLTWTGPVNLSNNMEFAKAGPGTLVLTKTSDSSLGTATVAGGTLVVTGTGGLRTTSTVVKTGATIAGKLVGFGANLNLAGGVTIESGGTLRAGTGGSTDHFGVGSATFASGSTFVVTADGGATPTSSRLTTEGGGAATVNFATNPANPITLRIEKGAGASFADNSLVTLEIVHTNQLTGGFFPNKVLRQGSPFVYDANDWRFETVGFDIVPGSASLITDANKTTLSVQFTVTPEPSSILALAAAGLALTLLRRRLT
jgi:fibronectin-binding autotransporter adhesin